MQEHHLGYQAGKILVAGGASGLAARIGACLCGDGHRVRTATDPEETQGLLESERFDLIVVEPSLSPARMLALLEGARRQQPVPVIFLIPEEESVPELLAALRRTAGAASRDSEQELLRPSPQEPLPMTLHAVERAHILDVLRQCRGNKKKTAALLGINRSSLYGKLKRFGIAVGSGGTGARRELVTR